jgi:hypothetical protein
VQSCTGPDLGISELPVLPKLAVLAAVCRAVPGNATITGVDRDWMRDRLAEFRKVCEAYSQSHPPGFPGDRDVRARMHRLEPTARAVLRALDPDLANFNLDDLAGEYEGIKAADRGLGMLADLDDVASRLRPEAPTLPADQLHPWVWDAARTFWDAGAHAVAVEQGAKSITAHTQQKTGCQLADDDLMSQVWSDEPPKAGRPRLRFPGDRTTKTCSPGSGAPAPWPRAATGAFGTSSPTSMRRTGRNSSPLSISHACQFWLAGSTKPRSNKESDLSCGWSALGPCGIGNRWSSAGTSGHGRRVSIAGHEPFTAPTSDGEGA